MCWALPIAGCIIADLSSGSKYIGRTIVYIVQNTGANDIICDLVVGRASLANSAYPCVDMRDSGNIYHPDTEDYIECLPCTFTCDTAGKRQLEPIGVMSTYIPEVVQKKDRIQQNRSESEND